MTTLKFKAIRIVYLKGGERKETVKTYETYEQAKTYAKRYSHLTGKAKFVEVEIKFDTDSFKFRNVVIYNKDSNGFENEHAEEIKKFQNENKEEETTVTVDGTEQTQTFVILDVNTNKKFVYYWIDKQIAVETAKKWAKKDGHVYKIYRRKNGHGRYIAAVNYKCSYIVGKAGEKPADKKYVTLAEAEAYAREQSEINNAAYKVYYLYLNAYGYEMRREKKTIYPVADEKVVGYRVGLGGTIYKTAAEAFESAGDKQVFKVLDVDGLNWQYQPIYYAPKTLKEWEASGKSFPDFCEYGHTVDEDIVEYFRDVLPPVTLRKNIVQCGEPYGHRKNPETGKFEPTYITFVKAGKEWVYMGQCTQRKYNNAG